MTSMSFQARYHRPCVNCASLDDVITPRLEQLEGFKLSRWLSVPSGNELIEIRCCEYACVRLSVAVGVCQRSVTDEEALHSKHHVAWTRPVELHIITGAQGGPSVATYERVAKARWNTKWRGHIDVRDDLLALLGQVVARRSTSPSAGEAARHVVVERVQRTWWWIDTTSLCNVVGRGKVPTERPTSRSSGRHLHAVLVPCMH
mmetsp:Transcript_4852/g.12046  ORF Transcript_4852/g.12046 Transcript_4852/m.12046 type:complete len:203 (-) Transcript_4852:743-1351(-)